MSIKTINGKCPHCWNNLEAESAPPAGYPLAADERRELERLRVHVVALAMDVESLSAQIGRLKAEKFRLFNNDECWIYQADGNNHLGSLTCPVVISAQKLIALGG